MATTPIGKGSQWPMIGVPTYQAGQIPAAPTPAPYFAPSPDLGRIQFLTQQAAAPGARKLRMGLLGALQAGRRAENPNVQALLGRQAVAGYGEGLESVMGGARREGMGLYAPEYAATTEEGKANWLAAREKERSDYLAAMEQYKPKEPISMAKPSRYTDTDSGDRNFGLGSGSDSDRIYRANTASMLGGGGGGVYADEKTLMLNRFSQNNPGATRGDLDAYKIKIGMETGQSQSYDDYIKKTYLSREINDLAASMPMGG